MKRFILTHNQLVTILITCTNYLKRCGTMTASIIKLTPDKLRYQCDLTELDFKTTATVPALDLMFGQERAVTAVTFGLTAKYPDYNIYVSGLPGTGKMTYALKAVQAIAANDPVPDDWCYVNNFTNPSQPIAFCLPAGLGHELREDVDRLIDELESEIPRIFNSEDYEQAKNTILTRLQEQRTQALEEFNQKILQLDITPQWSSTGFTGIPMHEGKTLTPEEFQQLPPIERERIEQNLLAAHDQALESIRHVQKLERKAKEELRQLDSKIALYAVGNAIDELSQKYREHEPIIEYFESVKQDVVNNIHTFKPEPDDELNPLLFLQRGSHESTKDKYRINLLVDNRETRGAPVIVETNPTYYNLVGRVEYETRMGMINTSFAMIKSGAFHRANGGYLILQIRDVLQNLGAWEGIKRALKTQQLVLENLGDQYSMLPMASLRPAAIPLQVKIVLIGSPWLYNLLLTHDEDFRSLFKVYADFGVEMDNTSDNTNKLVGFISAIAKRKGLKPVEQTAVAATIAFTSRLAGSQNKLSTRFNELIELLCEADVCANNANSEQITADHINQALAQKQYRVNRYEQKLQELFADGSLLIDTKGHKVGQINGLAVLQTGEYSFGKPFKITANSFIGKSGIVNIERETKASGTTHSKGVLTLSAYLGEYYAQRFPLAVTVSITFEQLYGGIDGDSASSAELYAILSSLADLPLKQGIAVTGSVNQKGEIQPIGGVNEKIEGYFAVCCQKGLTGEQGVLIPWQNIKDLNLNDQVIAAVAAGTFHIYAATTIDDGIELLTDISAGNRQPDGTYPHDSVHYRVSKKLQTYTETLLRLSRSIEGEAPIANANNK